VPLSTRKLPQYSTTLPNADGFFWNCFTTKLCSKFAMKSHRITDVSLPYLFYQNPCLTPASDSFLQRSQYIPTLDRNQPSNTLDTANGHQHWVKNCHQHWVKIVGFAILWLLHPHITSNKTSGQRALTNGLIAIVSPLVAVNGFLQPWSPYNTWFVAHRSPPPLQLER